MITSIFGFLVYSYFVLYSLLSFLWLKLNRYLDHNIFTKDRPNNIVIIGDSLAAGFGDWITTGVNGGLASRLKKYLAEDESLVLPWKVWNCGHFAVWCRVRAIKPSVAKSALAEGNCTWWNDGCGDASQVP